MSRGKIWNLWFEGQIQQVFSLNKQETFLEFSTLSGSIFIRNASLSFLSTGNYFWNFLWNFFFSHQKFFSSDFFCSTWKIKKMRKKKSFLKFFRIFLFDAEMKKDRQKLDKSKFSNKKKSQWALKQNFLKENLIVPLGLISQKKGRMWKIRLVNLSKTQKMNLKIIEHSVESKNFFYQAEDFESGQSEHF